MVNILLKSYIQIVIRISITIEQVVAVLASLPVGLPVCLSSVQRRYCI